MAARNRRSNSADLRAIGPVLLLFGVLSSILCALAHWRYAIFRYDVDLGIFTQVVAGIGHGFSSTAEGGVNHLIVHWSPIIATSWPFLRIFGPVGLQYFQALLVAAVVFPLWGLARARFSPPMALAIVAAAALYPLLCANGAGDFHEMGFVPLLCVALVYALDRRRRLMAVVVALLLLCTKEDQFIVLAANGVLFAVTSRGDPASKRIGWLIAGMAAAAFCSYFGVLRPLLHPGIPYDWLRFFNWHDGHTDWRAFGSSVLVARITYALMVLAPLAFLPCISRYGLFLIPGFVEILASHKPVVLAPGAHYSALLSGYALAAFVDGAYRVSLYRPRAAQTLVAVAAAASLWVTIFANPMEYWYYLYRRPNAHDALLEDTLRRLPTAADVGAEDEIFAHLGLDPNASVNFRNQRWFVYDRSHYSTRWRYVDLPAIRAAIARHDYVLVGDRDGIVVLRRAS